MIEKTITLDLPPVSFEIPKTFDDLVSGGPSSLGLSTISSYLSCPEAARLKSLGVRRKGGNKIDENGIWVIKEDPLAYGSYIHALRAIRLVYGQSAAMDAINFYDVDEASKMSARHIFKIYDNLFPLGSDPWEILGVEVEVVSEVAPGIIRTVRYDTVVRAPDGAVFSFECKTSSRGGKSALLQYTPQRFAHSALWNANPNLPKKYGAMRGSIYDLIVKSEVPDIKRLGPEYVSKLQQSRILEYLALPDRIGYPAMSDGAATRLMHTCWGRYSCPYTNGCFENAWGDYEITQ